MNDERNERRHHKKLWHSKSFWAAVLLFIFSLLTTIAGFSAIAEDPRWSGLCGMCFAVLWVALRLITDKPIDPVLNLPNPKDWWKK